jgi:hypothetical protein
MREQRWPLSMLLVSVMGDYPSQYSLVFSGDVGPGETTRRSDHRCLAAIRQTRWDSFLNPRDYPTRTFKKAHVEQGLE